MNRHPICDLNFNYFRLSKLLIFQSCLETPQMISFHPCLHLLLQALLQFLLHWLWWVNCSWCIEALGCWWILHYQDRICNKYENWLINWYDKWFINLIYIFCDFLSQKNIFQCNFYCIFFIHIFNNITFNHSKPILYGFECFNIYISCPVHI